MTKSQSFSHFPDINVWLALSAAGHIHHPVAARWLDNLGASSKVCFCRVTQMGFLRLLTSEAVLGSETLTQVEAWRAYDQFLEDERIIFSNEPPHLEREFRLFSSRQQPLPKTWTDSYLAAFSVAAELTLVTFDQGFRGRVRNLQLLSI